jgi:hypothetical protein
MSRRRHRLIAAALAAPCWAVLGTAAALSPREAGHGTHVQLFGQSCSFLARTGYPCPSCGMTTSFAAMAHGRVVLAWRAHPFGVALFAAVLGAAVAATHCVVRGDPWPRRLRPKAWWVVAALLGWLAGWGAKIAIGMAAGRYPLGR